MISVPSVVPNLPLTKHLLFETRDADEACDRVARVFRPHRLDCLTPAQDLAARQHVARLGKLALSYITYGADVEIDAGKMSTFFLIHLVPSGRCEINIGHRSLIGSANVGSVTSATMALRMRWSADCAHLVLKVERAALERHLSDLLGEEIMRPIEFEPELMIDTGFGASFHRCINFIAAELDCAESLVTSPLGVARVEQMLMTALLEAQPNSYSAALAKHASPAVPRHVMRAEEWIRAHPEQPLSIGDLVAVSGVSARTLFEGFRAFRGVTPMALLQMVRLEKAHADLRTAAFGETIAAIAFKWGFVNLGRFARDYRRRFGELPSETLRKAQGR